ncbi:MULTISPECIES: efflux RND transporter periplasmic adaptor subunit [unclassified Phenylobacterium]|uniref:efflux RND transporter periplasmic adaptor subunit n=1 Tax=unclassified Phenylobacterium TaxID=2640670 RepID=UPI00083B2047|nr:MULTISPECIES: efflux RND transporter periplasmic adaptor subunit [unclassified Phenylobacterium]
MRVWTLARTGALLALSLFVAGCGAQAQDKAGEPPPPQVTTAAVVTRDLRPWDEFTGRLEAVDTVQVRPRVGGYVDGVRFTEGAVVRQGQVLFQIDPRPFQAEVARLTAEVAANRAKLELAAANRQRAERLVEEQALSRSEYDRLVSEEKAQRAVLDAAAAALDSARLNLEFTRITAPISGRVSRAIVTPGNLVTSADVLTTVVSDTPIYATFNADEQTYLRYAASARSRPGPVYLGLMTDEGYPHEGRLVFVDNVVNARSGTIQGRALFQNADGRFTPGLFARIKLVGETAEPTALVPDRAIAADLGKRFVLAVGPGDVAQYRAIEVGPRVGDLRIVRSGLKPGEVIIVGGGQRVKPGQKVAPTRTVIKLPEAELAQVEARPARIALADTKAATSAR